MATSAPKSNTPRPLERAFRGLWPYLWKYRRTMGLGLSALVLKDVFAATIPLFMKAGVDSLTAGFGVSKLVWFTAGLLAFTAIKGVFQYAMRVILIGASRDIEYDLRARLFDRLLLLDSGFYAENRTGDIMARATNDMNAVRMMLGPGLMYWVETSLTFVLAVTVMLWVDWKLTLIALAPTPLVSVAVMIFGRRIHARFQKIQGLFSDISSRVQENLAGVRVLRAYAQEDAELARFEKVNRAFIGENIRLGVLSGVFMPVLEALIGLAFLVVLWAGGRRLLAGDLTIGSFLMFNFYLGMLGWPMIAMGWVVNLMQRGAASWERLEAMMLRDPAFAAGAGGRAVPEPFRGEIRLENVSVEFGATKALDGIDLTIPAGSSLAIAGHTGGGKSTLVNLIPRLIDPTRGRVLIDGVPVKDLDAGELRQTIGFVPQETFLFSATLGENIALGAPEATAEDQRRAAERAGLGPDIAGFPKGLETEVGERGLTLSGGQKQRTAIARALVRDPKILILDDALSSVDTVTEETILENLRRLMHGRTTILISHRVSTIRHADRIVVVENGRLVEQGSHDELIRLGGYYADLHQKQLLEEELEAI
ncbi:MAG: ABC transporter ATP-binding protein [Bryobacteraceae bacterium]